MAKNSKRASRAKARPMIKSPNAYTTPVVSTEARQRRNQARRIAQSLGLRYEHPRR